MSSTRIEQNQWLPAKLLKSGHRGDEIHKQPLTFGVRFELQGTMPNIPDEIPHSSSYSYTND